MQINTKLPLGVVFGNFKSSEQDLLTMLIPQVLYLVPRVETMIVAPLEMMSPMFIALPVGWSQVLVQGAGSIFAQCAYS